MHKGSKNSFVPGEILKYFEPSRTKQLIWRPTLEVGHWPSYVGFNATVGRIGQLGNTHPLAGTNQISTVT